ncbi:MAG: APC family permease [Candidatus Korarchaeum sp.]
MWIAGASEDDGGGPELGREEVSLKREVKLFGAFSMGYADVGADIYVAIGVVALFSAGAAPLSFIIASIVYVTTGLVYAELSSTYPLAGGAQVFAAKGLNDLFGFIAGWLLVLSYVVDISLFAVTSAGYLSFLLPEIRDLNLSIGPLGVSGIILIAVILICMLLFLNLIGIRESALFTEVLVAIDLVVETLILALGLMNLLRDPSSFLNNVRELGVPERMEGVAYLPGIDLSLQNFLYGTTLAMSSFVGIESIAQASEEIKRPYRWIPVATKMSVVSVLIFVLGLSFVSIGSVGWRTLAEHREMSLAALALSFPLIGRYASLIVAFTGFLITLASSNTGVVGVSRVLYSMGKFKLIPPHLSSINRRFRTPVRSIVLSGLLAVFLCFLGELERIADVYAVAALASYLLVNYSLIRIRRVERAFRPWKVPGDIKVLGRDLNLVAALGVVSTTFLLALVVLMHEVGRLIGFAWLVSGLALYVAYRKLSGIDVLGRFSADLMRPAEYTREALVLIRPYESDDVAEDIYHGLKGRYRLHLVTIVDPSGLSAGELREESEAADRVLRSIARELRNRGLEVDYRVDFGDPREVALSLASNDAFDFALVIIGKGSRKIEEGGVARLLMSKLPGKVLAIRR